MYSNAGKSIKGYVKMVVSTCVFLCILVGLLIGIFLANIVGFAGVIVGLLIAGVGSFLAWLSGLILYAFGDMADRLKRIDEKLNGPDQNEEGIPEAPTAENGWTCASCYTVNFKNHSYCRKCGVSQSWSNAEWEKKNK